MSIGRDNNGNVMGHFGREQWDIHRLALREALASRLLYLLTALKIFLPHALIEKNRCPTSRPSCKVIPSWEEAAGGKAGWSRCLRPVRAAAVLDSTPSRRRVLSAMRRGWADFDETANVTQGDRATLLSISLHLDSFLIVLGDTASSLFPLSPHFAVTEQLYNSLRTFIRAAVMISAKHPHIFIVICHMIPVPRRQAGLEAAS
jgi:hypothetical protein